MTNLVLWMVNRNLTTGLGSINVQHTTRIGKLLPPGVRYRVVGARGYGWATAEHGDRAFFICLI